ncbi:MAG: hypothetical protein AAB587_02650 [Patescibacteria group bacterium]
MAEKAEKEKKPTGAGDPTMTIIEVGVIVIILTAVVDGVRRLIAGPLSATQNFFNLTHWQEVFGSMTPFLKVLSVTLTFLFIVGILHINRKLNLIRAEERARLYPPNAPSADSTNAPAQEAVNRRWDKVIKFINSVNPADWKIAILEADIMLDEMLEKMGYGGETMGDKLKSVEASDFLTLNSAWEAHKIRNTIAHDGTDFLLNEREAKRIVDLYKQVFDEFKYI